MSKAGLCVLALVACAFAAHVVEKDALTVQGEAMLEQIKASQASCSFNGANFAPLTQSSGTDYTYSSSDNHYTWCVFR